MFDNLPARIQLALHDLNQVQIEFDNDPSYFSRKNSSVLCFNCYDQDNAAGIQVNVTFPSNSNHDM